MKIAHEELRQERKQKHACDVKYVALTVFFGTLVFAIAMNFLWVQLQPQQPNLQSSTAVEVISIKFIDMLKKYGENTIISNEQLQKDLKYMQSQAHGLKDNVTKLLLEREEWKNKYQRCAEIYMKENTQKE